MRYAEQFLTTYFFIQIENRFWCFEPYGLSQDARCRYVKFCNLKSLISNQCFEGKQATLSIVKNVPDNRKLTMLNCILDMGRSSGHKAVRIHAFDLLLIMIMHGTFTVFFLSIQNWINSNQVCFYIKYPSNYIYWKLQVGSTLVSTQFSNQGIPLGLLECIWKLDF